MKILVAMSGGVDSTVAAYLLQKQGNEVIGVNFAFAGVNDTTELDEIAKKLNIKIIYRDFREEFHDKVIASFVHDYECGMTPNPCALCNGIMKFEKLLQVMKEEGCDMIATGHYANVSTVGAKRNIVGADIIRPTVGAKACIVGAQACQALPRYCVKKSKNEQKDQSYMLYRLNQEQLSHIVFPIGNMDKNEVRKVAAELGLSVADKKDSQDVCFIKDISYKEFIKRFEFGDDYKEKIARGELKEEDILSLPYFKKGEFVDTTGNVLGFHDGIINYTIGQRRGINIAFGERKFVVKIDVEKNQVVLGDNDDLQSSDFQIYDIVYSGMTASAVGAKDNTIGADTIRPTVGEDTTLPIVGATHCEPVATNYVSSNKKLFAKLRYRHDGTEVATVGASPHRTGDSLEPILSVKLTEPVRAITRGQSAVFYDENGCIMFGGRIL